MCDYSLMHVPNRLARNGDELITHRFRSGTLGLVSQQDKNRPIIAKRPGFWERLFGMDDFPPPELCAVCVPPGAKLRIENGRITIGAFQQLDFPVMEVVFTQSAMEENIHRDGFVTMDGVFISLQEIEPGAKVTVLSLLGAYERQSVNENLNSPVGEERGVVIQG